MNNNKFWLENINVLYKNSNYLDFIPLHEMSRVEKLNAITRFAIYILLLNMSFNMSDKLNYLAIGSIVITLIIYFIMENDNNEKQKEVNEIINKKKDKLIQAYKFKKEIDPDEEEGFIDNEEMMLEEEEKPYDLEVGYLDSDGEMRFEDNLSVPSEKNSIDPLEIYKTDEIINANKHSCKEPTENNPFMNPTNNDFGQEDIPKACNVEDDEIHNKAINFLNKDLYRNTQDLFDLHNSQRQFYAVPNRRIVPNTVNFAKLLYDSPQTCKENQTNCLKYEDLRFNR